MRESTDLLGSYKPSVGDTCFYITRGGVNWCACKIIAEYEDLIWIHNFYTGAHPIYKSSQVYFKQIPVTDLTIQNKGVE